VVCWGLIVLINFEALAIEPRQVLTTEQFLSLGSIKTPISMENFSAQGKQQSLNNSFQGRLSFSTKLEHANLQLTENSDVYQFEKRTRPEAFTQQRKVLPEINIEFVQLNNKIIPTSRDLQLTEHPHWDYFIGVGNI